MDEYPEKIPEHPEPDPTRIERLTEILSRHSPEARKWLRDRIVDAEARATVEEAEEILREGE